MAVDPKGRNAVTHFKVLKRYDNYTLLELKIDTGRTHQIRVHMSYIGHPVVGDEVYSNGKNEFGVQGQMLHARYLQFKHPITGKELSLEAPIPEYFEDVLEKLKNREIDKKEFKVRMCAYYGWLKHADAKNLLYKIQSLTGVRYSNWNGKRTNITKYYGKYF